MKFKLFLTIAILATIHQSFSMTREQRTLNNQLFAAVLENNINEVASLLQAGADINSQTHDGETPLHEAARCGHTSTVDLLLSKGADIDAKDKYSNTPLYLATQMGNIEIVELLLSKNADINAKNERGYTALNMTANSAIAELLLSKGADINAKDMDSSTPLHKAIFNGHAATVILLLAHDVDINGKDYLGWTPLHKAALKGYTSIAKLLLARGADINAKDNIGFTPLYDATFNGHTSTAELLKNYQALLEQAQKPTRALLEATIERGYYALVKLLLQRGLKPDVSDLQLAKEKWQTAEDKQSYEAIGCLLVKSLALTCAVGLRTQGAISKSGIVGLYKLPESIAQEIAKHL